ncbi:MAG: molybdopterin-dependent oxidoreductase [Candidatus Marinimicrobia bacterium]|nr:molybdopterin-dependent oxidoreductase [Candidatus Neomarinimicrobiota bacterium]
MKAERDFQVVNHSVRKVDAWQLATGYPSYTADLAPAGCLHVKMLWSPHAHARLRSVDIAAAERMPGVRCVLYHGNVPRHPYTTAGEGFPEPSPYDQFVFDRKVRFVGDRVAAVAAETPAQAEAALAAIRVDYEVLEPVLSLEAALAPGAPVIHDEPDAYLPIPMPYCPQENIVARVGMEDVGDFADGLARADVRLDQTFETQYVQHAPMETYVAWAALDGRNRIQITTSTQVPFHCRRLVAQALGLSVGQIRVIKPRIGGGFGSKQEVLLEDLVALFALRTRRPVLWELSRAETFTSGRTRHPIRVRVRAGVTRAGALTALGLDCTANTGAYGGHGIPVVMCCGSKVLPLYRAETVHFAGQIVYTNLPVAGAYRGFGATQAYFGTEQVMDQLAEGVGLDPLEFRLRNHIRSGETSPVFAALGEGKEGVPMTIGSCALEACLRQGAAAIGWDRRRPHTEKTGRLRRGLGMAALMQGSSIPRIDMGAASIKINDDGSFNLLVGATDLGTGSDTVLAQIAAETLGVAVDKILVYSSDTDLTPFDVGAYASSTTYLSGMAVKKAAADARGQVLRVAAAMLAAPVEGLLLEGGVIRAAPDRSVTLAQVAHYALYERDQFQIIGTASHVTEKSPPPFAAHFVEIEVDTWTGAIRPLRYVAAVDCGTPINPKLAEGQTEGAVLNGISFALTEQYLFTPKGRLKNASLEDYHLWSLRDKPPIQAILVSSFEETGPYGAKSVSEISINGAAPAIGNALYNAVGVRLHQLPFTRERVWRALQSHAPE